MAITYSIEEARRVIADHGLIARPSANGTGLIVYDGDEDFPGTWMEVARLTPKDGRVSSAALQSVVA